jgi:perosamine synthetase
MKIRRTIPPTAAPVKAIDLARGFFGLCFGGQKQREKLEQEIKEHFGVRWVWCVSSGKAALTLILLALKSLSKRRRVVIPAYTCFSVPSAVVKAGLEVSLCDINTATLDFDPRCLKTTVDEDTLCVIPSHLFGVPSDIDLIARLCRERGAYLVEDAAQAMGGVYNGKKIGTIGDVGFFSLGRGKNITCGSGGILVTNSAEIARAIEPLYAALEPPGFLETAKEFLQLLLMAVFIRPVLYWLPDGLAFLKLGETLFYKDFPVKKLSEMKARCLWNWPKRLEAANLARSGTADYFREHLPVKQFSIQPGVSYLRLPLVLDSRATRERLYHYARAKGLGLSRMYPTAISEIEEIKRNFAGQAYPTAKAVAKRLITLPTHHLLRRRDRQAVSDLFRSLEIQGIRSHDYGESAARLQAMQK